MSIRTFSAEYSRATRQNSGVRLAFRGFFVALCAASIMAAILLSAS